METNDLQTLRFIEAWSDLIDKKAKALQESAPDDPYESKSTKELATALSTAQGEFVAVAMNQENPYFKQPYADLDALELAVRPILAKYGLSYTQQTKLMGDNSTVLVTRLRHGDEWIETRARLVPVKNDLQTYGSTEAFLKRTQLSNILGISWGHEDDDAERASFDLRSTKAKGVALNLKYNPKEVSYETITRDQLKELEYELSQYPDIAEQVLNGLRLQSLADMPKSKFDVARRRIVEIKNARNGLHDDSVETL